jgi:stearoyl-CoA desaturase (delta-9 desaturase)
MDRISVGLFVGMHASALFVFAVPFSWRLVAMAAGSYALRMWGITAGYHRYFAHRSFRTSRVFQFLLALLGTTAMQNGPLWWASTHRHHHRHSDTQLDLHSPARRGFWYAHAGWIFDLRRPDPDRVNVKDLERYPELCLLDRHNWTPITAYGIGCYLLGGAGGLVWGFVVSTLALFHCTALVNSLSHVWGTRRFETRDRSRNNALLAVLTLGEGWHNNHHHCMSSARQGFLWWELDVTYYVLRALSWLGVVWDLREPRLRDGDGSRSGSGSGNGKREPELRRLAHRVTPR